MKANELFVTDFTNVDTHIEKAQSIIQSPEFKKMVDNILDSPDLINLLNSFSAQYGMKFGDYTKISSQSDKIKRLEKTVKTSFNKLSNEEKKGLDYNSWRKKVGLTTDDIRKMVAANETIHV